MRFRVGGPRLEARAERSRAMVYLTPLVAAGLTVMAGAVLFAALGHDPLRALYVFFVAPLTTTFGLSELFVKATPLVLCATGLAVGFRGNVWNIGAEGQLILGAIFAGGLALWAGEAFTDGGGPWLLPGMMVMGILGGMAWAAIPALLRTRFNANEILVSLMLTYVAGFLLGYLVHGPWRDPMGFNFPESALFGDAALLPALVSGTRLHIGALFALAAVAGAWVLLMRSFIGFQIKVVGLAPRAGGYAGFSGARVVWLGLLCGGGLSGLAGMVEVAGPIGQLHTQISPGYGFTAIIVAFLGRLHPLGILLAGLFMALTYLGGDTLQIELGLPRAVTGLFQGMVLFFLLASDVLIHHRVRWSRPPVTASVAPRGETA
ncbi:ABC transporter permease [Roseospira visakhapatnamensis]|uniref:Simple sugar transport system permease protein n=1 Tax=Roseospira visakhapatnamensis TaxID=390880 RepID=A0A7W6W9Y5_9PROT|nr:ABC transporter permease [Roseospira visakhapatnamensis]MBB4266630.1 simple sugar transport system permease protein [Roseospira visakhapatnamensis]